MSAVQLAIGTVWAIAAALVGLKGINYVAKVATFLPLIPLVILLILAAKTISGVGNFKPEMLAAGADGGHGQPGSPGPDSLCGCQYRRLLRHRGGRGRGYRVEQSQ